jgi:hypothetical protein
MTSKHKKKRKHTDGSICLEGTRRVPKPYTACCEAFDSRTVACTFDIRYEWWPKLKTWVVPISDASGGGGVAINHCPHCGMKLKGSKKEGRWLEI